MRRLTSSKEIVLALTGSIAAYKGCEVASRLTQLGARVQPVMTYSATKLVGAATLEGICGRRVITEMFDPQQNPDIEHISVATRADLFLIAPATANVLAKAAHGIADDWLTTALLVTRAPILFAPAMNSNMYTHPATQANLETLRARGCHFVGPDSGLLACGMTGPGRMMDPERVIEAALPLLDPRTDLAGKRVVLTCGANHEPIDPVRFIGNRSSGKMGRAIAIAAHARGARVTAVCGPMDVAMPHGIDVIPVETGRQMHDAVLPLMETADIFIGAAAVADYHVANASDTKHKRSAKAPALELAQNPDIAAAVGALKSDTQLSIGFAAETHDLVEHAREKLQRKHLDLIVANEVGCNDSGFGAETTRAQFIAADGGVEALPLMEKEELADRLMDRIVALLSVAKASSTP